MAIVLTVVFSFLAGLYVAMASSYLCHFGRTRDAVYHFAIALVHFTVAVLAVVI